MTASEPGQEHPEELLHRARAGLPLSARERRLRLEHLRACDVCRLLEETRVSLLDEAARAQGDHSGKSIAELVAATMASYQAPEARRPPSQPIGPRGRGRARHPARMAALAALVVCAGAGVALAAHWIAETRTAERAHEAASARVAAHLAHPSDRAAGGLAATSSVQVATEAAPAAPGTSPAPAGGAAALFARATEARRAGQVDDARRFYDRLWQEFPGTVEAQTGRVAYARWLLDRHEAQPAAGAFADYLRSSPRGTLAAEASVGLAEALELSGDRPRARRAWQEVLDNPAAGAFADHAKARLRSLDAPARQLTTDGVRPR